MGDLGLIPGLRRSPGEAKGYPLQYSGLENSMDSTVHEVVKSQTWLSDFHSFTESTFRNISCCFYILMYGHYHFQITVPPPINGRNLSFEMHVTQLCPTIQSLPPESRHLLTILTTALPCIFNYDTCSRRH